MYVEEGSSARTLLLNLSLMIQKIAMSIVREARVAGTQIFSYFEFTRLTKMLNGFGFVLVCFFSSNMSALFLLRDVSIHLTHSHIHVS